jgi:4-amino-4-deoxy-L-arabinose transferase-like glycosyltransferase
MKLAARAGLIAAVGAFVLFAALGRADLFNPDEPREAELAREMWATGDLLVPRLNAEPFLEKPPLFYWLVTAAYHAAGGPSEAAARVVPACAGLLCVLLTYLFGRAMVGERAAAMGALVLLTSCQFFWTARRCFIDVPLTLAILVACGSFHRGVVLGGRRRYAWLLLGYLASGAAVLFKGLVGAAIPALALAGFIVLRRDWRGIVRHALIPGAALALVPAALWAGALWRGLGPAAARDFVWVNNVLRFTGGAQRGHENPVYYYLPTLLLDFAPWSLLLPFALAAAWAAMRRRGNLSLMYLIVWFALPLALLSLASTKRGIYLLPIYPAAALLIGWWLADEGPRADEPRPVPLARRIAGTLLLGGTIVLAAVLLAALLVARPGAVAAPAVLVLLVFAAGLAAFRALRSGRTGRLGFTTAGLCALLEVGAVALVVPALVNRDASARDAGRLVRSLVESGNRVALYRVKEGSLGGYLFYSGMTLRNLKTPEELQEALETGRAGPGRASNAAPEHGRAGLGDTPTLVLMQEDVHANVSRSLTIPTTVVRRFGARPEAVEWFQGRSMVLIAPLR